MRSRVGHRSLALFAAAALGFGLVATVLADAPLPTSASVSVNGTTATLSGNWTWSSQKAPCDSRWVGWAVDWNDPNDSGNQVANGFSVGTSSDNSVHTNQNCGSAAGSGVQGSWGQVSHTYPGPGTYSACVVMYDIHVDKTSGQPKPSELVAGGTGRNTDNSVEANGQAPSGPGCANVTIASPAKLVVNKSVNETSANPGDTLTYTITIENTGGTAATGVSASDNIGTLLAHGSFVSCSGGCSGGSTLTWSGLSIAAFSTTTLQYSVALATSGWATGTTNLPNSVVVPNSNCDANSNSGDCRASTTVSSTVNLVVRKSVNQTTAAPGDTLSYTITIQNTGNASATGVSASDDISGLLAHGSFVSCTVACSGGSTLTWSGLTVGAGSTVTLQYSIRLAGTGWPNGMVTLPNAIVVPNSNCASGSNNAACRTSTTVSSSANLVVRKSVSETTANPGDSLTYTIAIQNTGTGGATGVSASDNISSLLAHGSFVSCSAACSSGSTLGWSGLSIAAGSTLTLSYVIKLDSTGWSSGTTSLPNSIAVPNSDCASGSNNSACRTATTVTPAPNLVVRKSVSDSSADPGQSLTYSVLIQNTGNGTATGVSASDDISALLAHGSLVTCSAGCSGSSTLTWSNLTVNAGSSITLSYVIKLDSAGWATGTTTIPNSIVVPNSDCAAGSGNSACRASVSIAARATLTVRKTVDRTSADPGSSLTYTITVANTGNAGATGVSVVDDLSSLLAHGSFLSASSGYSLSGGALRWDGLSIAAGTTRTLTVSIRLGTGTWSAGTTTLTNTAVVSGSDCASGASNSACRASSTVTPHLGLSITKGVSSSSSGPFGDSVNTTTGATVWYSIRVANTGNADLSGVTISDSMGLPGGQCPSVPSSLSAGASWACTYPRTATLGTTSNTAAADSDQTSRVTDTATVTASPPPAPAIRLIQAVSASTLPVGGGSVTYTYFVSNPGNVPLSSIIVSDDTCTPASLQSGDANGNTKLDPGETWRFTCTANLTKTTTDTASAGGTFGTARVTDTNRTTVVVIVGAPALHITESASATQLPVGGGSITYTYLVTNAGNAALSNVTVSDNRCSPVTYQSGDTNSNGRLDLNETWRFGCSAQLTATTTDTATASGSFSGTRVTDSDSATITVPSNAPGIHVVKAANPGSLPAGGGSVTYTYVVTNTGNVALSNVSLSDNRCSTVKLLDGDANGNGRLDLSETWHFTCTMTLTATTSNTATVSGQSGGTTVRDTDQATVAVTASHAAINVSKTANPISLPAGGGQVRYTYIVTNKGNVPLLNVTVSDDTCSPVTLSGGDSNGNDRLDLGETWTWSCSTRVNETTTNTAIATGFAAGNPVSDTDTALVTVGTPTVHTPRIGLVKTADPVSLTSGGGTVSYEYDVTNKGDVPLSTVSVADDTCGPVAYESGDLNKDDILDLTETWVYGCTVIVTDTTTNTATAMGHYAGQAVTASDQATVIVAPPVPTPTPEASAEPSANPSAAPSAGPGASGGPSESAGSSAGPSAGSSAGAAPGSSETPGGSVAGVTSPPGAGNQGGPSNEPEPAGLGGGPPGSTPSAPVMILILVTALIASVVILTLSRRPPKP